MNIDQTLKVNKLASELRKHGFAASSEEAFNQARGMAGDGVQPNSQSTPTVPTGQTAAPQSYLEERQTELLVQMHTKKLQDQFQQLLGHVQRLADEVVTLRGELTTFKDGYTQKVVQVVQETQKVLPKEVTEPTSHPRSGNFKSADVAIDKYFNFGSGKK